jgi:hypothetical protein
MNATSSFEQVANASGPACHSRLFEGRLPRNAEFPLPVVTEQKRGVYERTLQDAIR